MIAVPVQSDTPHWLFALDFHPTVIFTKRTSIPSYFSAQIWQPPDSELAVIVIGSIEIPLDSTSVDEIFFISVKP